MAADIASLGFAIDTADLKDANAELKALPASASAAERAVEKFSATTMKAANSNEQFSRRAQRVTKDLEFESQQLARSAAEREKYAALRRAGVTAMSAEGQALAASVSALQAQRAAAKTAAESTVKMAAASRESGLGFATMLRFVGPLALGMLALQQASKIWEAGLKAGDLGEQADQVGVSTDQLQAYRFVAAQAGVETETMDTAVTKLAKAMGTANDGNKEMIERFQQLGVKLLDANGELRSTGDVLPEVARGVLAVGSTSQRTAILMELFGRSGAKMTTILEELAKGNDALVISARAQGAILDKEVIDAWDRVSDAMKRAQLEAEVTNAKLGAPIATAALENIEKILKSINGVMDQINSKEGFWASILSESRANGSMGGLKLETPQEKAARQRAALQGELNNPANAGREGMIQADINRLDQQAAAENFARLGGLQGAGVPSGRFLPGPAPSVGARNPTAKATGSGSDPYKKAIASAKEYTALKNAETAAVGLNAQEAARLKHEQELVNKASEDATKLTPVQITNLKGLAAAMAEADAKFASAKFMDDANKKATEFIQTQEIERATLFMSQEAGMAYRLEKEMLNKATADGITLTQEQIDKIHELAGAQAAAAEKTRVLKDMVDFGKEAFQGFFADMRQGLQDGKSVIESFGDAFMNVLDKIADKLMQMAIDDLFNAALGGAKGGSGGGLFSLIGSVISGIAGGIGGGGGEAFGPPNPFFGPGFAKGGAFDRGNVIPFARGGIVSSPTLFPMARGAGLMGEAGPEGVLPLRRGRGGRLGVDASGAGGGGTVVIVNNNAPGTKATARESKGPGGQNQIDVIVEAVEGKMAGRLSRGQGSLGKTMEGSYGLQRVGR